MASTTTTSHHHHHHHHHYGGGGGGGNGSNNGHYYPNNANSNHHHSHFAHHVRTKAWGIQPGWKFVASESSTVRKPPNYIAESPAAGSTAPAAAVTSKDRFQYFENGIGRIHPPSSSSAAAASSYLASLDARKPASSYSTSLSPRSQPKHYEISPISSDLSPRSSLNGFEPAAPPRPRRSLHPPLTSVSSTGSSSGSSSASSSSNKDDSNDGSGSEEKADYINHHRLRNSSLSRPSTTVFSGASSYRSTLPRVRKPLPFPVDHRDVQHEPHHHPSSGILNSPAAVIPTAAATKGVLKKPGSYRGPKSMKKVAFLDNAEFSRGIH